MFAAPFEIPPPPDCHATGCTTPSLVHWQRRLTAAEVAVEHAREQGRRDARMILRDIQLPPPDFGPLPDPASYSYLVHACGDHAIGIDAAALIHRGHCAGPNSSSLPDCDCTPEAAAEPAPHVEQKLPAHWITGGG